MLITIKNINLQKNKSFEVPNQLNKILEKYITLKEYIYNMKFVIVFGTTFFTQTAIKAKDIQVCVKR